MVYECKLKLVGNSFYISAAFVLVAIVVLYFLDLLEEKYLYSVLGASIAFIFSYLLTRSKVRVETNEGWLKIYHSGMVQANVEINSIKQLTEKAQGNMTGVEIETNENLKYFVPTSCFSEVIKQEIMSHLKKE